MQPDGCWLPSQGSCEWVGVETQRPPSQLKLFFVQTLLSCCPEPGPAHIPAKSLWVSGLELVSVRGMEFSQGQGPGGSGQSRAGQNPKGSAQTTCFLSALLNCCVSLGKVLCFSEYYLAG